MLFPPRTRSVRMTLIHMGNEGVYCKHHASKSIHRLIKTHWRARSHLVYFGRCITSTVAGIRYSTTQFRRSKFMQVSRARIWNFNTDINARYRKVRKAISAKTIPEIQEEIIAQVEYFWRLTSLQLSLDWMSLTTTALWQTADHQGFLYIAALIRGSAIRL